MSAGMLAIEQARMAVLLSGGDHVAVSTADMESVVVEECAEDLRGFVLLFGDLGRSPDDAVDAWIEEWDLREL